MKHFFQKVGSLFLLLTMFGMSPPSYSQVAYSTSTNPITLIDRGDQDEKERSLKQVLLELQRLYGVNIFFSDAVIGNEMIDPNLIVSGNMEKSLNNLLLPLGLTYEKVQDNMYVVNPNKPDKIDGVKEKPAKPVKNSEDQVIGHLSPLRLDQIRELPKLALGVTGVVTDSENEPLPGVNVVEKGTTNGTITTIDGTYTIDVSGGATLIFSSVGFLAQDVPVNNRVTINVSLNEDVQQLDELVVVGYGSVKKSDLTGSVASVKAEQIENLTINSVQQALAGQAPGVAVGTGSAMPGGGVSIRIRGSNSLSSNNEPLYVIDGFPIVANSGEVPSGNKGNTVLSNPLANLNPNDIQSIEILKDASATAIYGSRGANGVIIITTKTGTAGKTNVSLDSYYGVQEIQKLYDVLEAPEFIKAANEAATETGGEIPFPNGTDWYTGDVNTDWQKEIYRTAPIQNHQLSITSGNDKSRLAISLGYFDQQGIVKKSGFERYSLRVNSDTKLGNLFTVGTNLMVSRVLNNRVPTEGHNNQNAGPTNAALFYRPTLPVRNPDGTYAQVGADGSPALQGSSLENPVAQLYEINNQMTKDNILGNAFVNFEIAKGLNLRSSLGISLSNAKRNYYASRNTNRGGRGNDGLAIISDAQGQNILNENTLTYDVNLGSAHHINALVGYTIQKEITARSSMTNTNFPNDITQFDNIGSGTRDGGPSIWSSKRDWRMVSYLARLNYSLLDRYLFTATVRSDGSSKFGRDNKWASFPSAALAWRVSEEQFMADVDWLTNFKLRASWGVTGNSEIGSYRSLARFSSVDYSYDGSLVPGFYPNSIANPELRWETTTQTNFGVDLGFFENRLTLVLDWYDKVTEDLLLDITLPYNTGYTSATTNFGRVRNQGYEIGLGADLFVSAFQWHTDFNISHNQNQVTDLGDLGTIFGANVSGDFKWSNATQVTEGQPMGVFYGFRTGGVFRDMEDVQSWEGGFMYNAEDPSRGAQPGDRKFYDVDQDGELTVDDREILGNPHPNFVFGWNNSMSYGNFSLNMFWQGAVGHDVLNVNRWQLFADGVGGSNIAVERYTDRWTPENPNATWPRFGNPIPVGENIQDWVLEDGDFVRLRNITLSYNLPTLNINWLQKARIYVSGDNLLLLTNYTGYDPDVNTMMGGGQNYTLGIDNGSYPSARVYKAGFQLTF